MQPSFRLGRWGSSILPLAKRQQSPFPRAVQCYSARFQSTVQIEKPSNTGTPVKKRAARVRTVKATRALNGEEETQRIIAKASSRKKETVNEELLEEVLDDEPTAAEDGAHGRTSARTPATPAATRIVEPTSRNYTERELMDLPSPPPERALTSAKLAALHARLSLPVKLPLQSLARCLVDKSADPDPRFNNHHLSNLGNDLLGYYIGEHYMCNFPRLPMVVLKGVMNAHVGPKALEALAQSWGIECAAEPGGEVDPGLLQFRRPSPMKRDDEIVQRMEKQAEVAAGAINPLRRTLEIASSFLCRAIVGAVFLHGGAERVKAFIQAHFLSRQLDLHTLFTFEAPTRDLSRLCAREGFEAPIARVISETGRVSRHPVFVVGIYSGRDILGQDAGASLNEARFKAAAKALKGWYLYSPRSAIGGSEIMVPSMMEGRANRDRVWQKAHIDDGEIIV